MPVIATQHLFEVLPDRVGVASELVRELFPRMAREAIRYELLGQGLLASGAVQVSFDYWEMVRELQHELQALWDGPDVAVYLLPIREDISKNGVSYERGICLFISPTLTPCELQALFTHEYCHSCHRPYLNDPPTLMDSLITEGLAEYAVESLYGEEALSPWTTRYLYAEVVAYWLTYVKPKLYETGLHKHRELLIGGEQTPPRLGYCTGYRIVKEFLGNEGPHSVKDLLTMRTETIVGKAGFEIA
ncbi:MAG: DUF2268 domain-containing putative Zn-dependent protease [Solibacillus sp.]